MTSQHHFAPNGVSHDNPEAQMALNRALGNLGGGQKSWMNPGRANATPSTITTTTNNNNSHPTATPPIKRKRGRPPLTQTRSHNPLLQQQHQNQFRAASNSAATGLASPAADRWGSQPSSNSTSPQLPNHFTVHPNPLPSNFPPSPSPSEDRNAEHTFDHPKNIQGHVVPPTRATEQSRATIPQLRFITAPSPSISPSPVFPNTTHVLSSNHTQPTQGLVQSQAPTSYSQVQAPSQSPADAAGNQHIQQHLPTPRPPHDSYPVTTFVNASTIPSPSYQVHHQATQPASGVQDPSPGIADLNQPSHQHEPQQVSTHQVQPVSHHQSRPLALTNIVQHQNAIEAFKANNQYSNRDVPRLIVLQEALEAGDTDYLAMHQIYCLLDSEPRLLPQTLINHPNMEYTRLMLRGMLDWNDNLSPNVLHFFCNFPKPITEIATSNPYGYSNDLIRFGRMLDQCVGLAPLLRICRDRNYPPLVMELLGLGITSLVFQRVAFRACLRRMFGDTDSPNRVGCENKCSEIFIQNQQDFNFRFKKIPSAKRAGDHERREREHEKQKWAPRLIALCAEYITPPNGPQPPPPGLPSQLPPQQSAPTEPVQSGHQTSLAVQDAPSVVRRGRGRPRVHHASPYPPVQPSVPSPSNRSLPQQAVPNIPAHPHVSAQPIPRRQPAAPPLGRIPPNQGSRPRDTRIFPQPWVALPQQRVPNPGRFALHQAHLRSPVIKAKVPGDRLYQYAEQCLQDSPRPLPDYVADRVVKWHFSISPELIETFPTVVNTIGAPPSIQVDELSNRMRIRSVKWPSTQLFDDHAWATADCSWVPYSIYMVNGKPLELRKKLHHGKDLPVDITSLLKAGENTIEITVMGSNTNIKYQDYLIGFEILRVIDHEQIRKFILCNTMSSEEVLNAIEAKLSGVADDDELSIVQTSLTINLIDPFSASTICNIPVRSIACTRNDCFDLETFLNTRERKGDCSVADKWKCPICNADARPRHLRVDGFLREVRTELEHRGLTRTRTIVVQQNGTWSPKDQLPEDDRPTPEESERATPAAPVSAKPHLIPSKEIEIIDLSD